jgi:hypothetical protein
MDPPEAVSILARTPNVLQTLLAGLPPECVHRNDGAGTWSAYDIVGHLKHGDATNWMPRTRMILNHGTGRPFEAFDREAMLREDREPVDALVAGFQQARQASLDELSALGLTAADMAKRGLHPDLGEVALGQLVAAWVTHDLTHLAQIGEVLARRYRTDAGPWRVYMPALDRVAEAE